MASPPVLDPQQNSPANPSQNPDQPFLDSINIRPANSSGPDQELNQAESPMPPPEDEQDQEEPPSLGDRIEDLRDRYQDIKERLSKPKAELGQAAETGVESGEAAAGQVANVGAETAGVEAEGTALRGVEKKAVQAGSKKVATRAAEETAKTAVKHGAEEQAARVAAERTAVVAAEEVAGEALVPVVGWIVGAATLAGTFFKSKTGQRALSFVAWGVAGFLVILGLIFVLPGLRGTQAIPPSNAAQVEQAQLLSALSGNAISQTKTIQAAYQSEKDRYGRVLDQAKQNSSDKVALVQTEWQQMDTMWQTMLQQKTVPERKQTRDAIVAKIHELDSQLPFSDWIVKKALSLIGQATNACNLPAANGSGQAPTSLGCADFTSTVLYEVGVPQNVVLGTDTIWTNPQLSIVVNRPSTLSTDTYAQNKGSLKPGDIVWWGDGKGAKGKLFNHVGIYVGDNPAACTTANTRGSGSVVNTVDNSSTNAKIMCGYADRTDSGNIFNGAKRYNP